LAQQEKRVFMERISVITLGNKCGTILTQNKRRQNVVLNGFVVNRTTKQRVKIGDRMIIGRGVDADLCIDDRVASRSHVEIVRDKMGFSWRDLGSRNGTLINGVHETGGKLRNGDHLRIGDTDIVFETETEGQHVDPTREERNFAALLATATNNKKLAPELQKTCQILNPIYKVLDEIAGNYDVCCLQDRILEMVLPVIKAYRGALFLANESSEIIPCTICGHVHCYVEGQISHAEREGVRISTSVVGQVLKQGKCVYYEDTESVDPAKLSESIMYLGLRSIICVPLMGKSRILGLLYIDTNQAGQNYKHEDFLLISAVGAGAGIALENAFTHRELMEKQRQDLDNETAWAMMEGFLCRDWKVNDSRFEVFGETNPAKPVGGDFFDFVQPDKDTVGILIGDISGKGVPAALAMAQILADFRILAQTISSPSELVKELNLRMLRRSTRGMFCTLVYARLDLNTGSMVWANAGHLPALFMTPDTNSYTGEAGGPPIGVEENAEWSEAGVIIEPGTTVLYFTNGIIESRSIVENQEEFGMSRLWGATDYGTSPEFVLEDVNNALKSYLKGAEAHDDCAMIALRYLGCEYEDAD